LKIVFKNISEMMVGHGGFLDELRETFPGVEFVVPDSEDQVINEIVDAEAICGIPTIDEYVAAKSLRWVHQPASGVHMEVGHPLIESDVVLTNSPGPHAIPMADYVFAVMLNWTHRMEERMLDQRAHLWAPEKYRSGLEEVSGQTMGILGFGGVGQAVARRAHGFDMKVYAVARTEKPATPEVEAVWGENKIEDLLKISDWFVITAPLTPSTRCMINRERVAMMKPGARVIVLSRAHIIDEQALTEALQSGHIAGAAFDNFETPDGVLPSDSPLWDMPNVVITPHTSSNSDQLESGRRAIFIENLHRFLNGEQFIRVCDKQLGY
jgi:phosphoglycerate dehydrogenase-like enzyme